MIYDPIMDLPPEEKRLKALKPKITAEDYSMDLARVKLRAVD